MSGSFNYTFSREYGYNLFSDDESSDNEQNSSEDEIDVILNGTLEQKRKLQHLHKKWLVKDEDKDNMAVSSSSSEDEFEKEMDAELNLQVELLEKSRDNLAIKGSSVPTCSGQKIDTSVIKSKNLRPNAADEFYDDIYFDSDEDEDNASENTASKNRKHKIISNDDLLYDPDMDDRDQRWVDKQRQKHGNSASGKQGKKANSDALLDCPACMTTLCIDCQRHEIHKNQYRAMFVMNCSVDTSETLECPEQPQKKKGKKKFKQQAENSPNITTTQDLFNPVRCTECSTVVGVYDSDEVYHFFNVLASYT